jgi:hypothetical protein
MIKSSFDTFLMTLVCGATLQAAPLGTAGFAAILVPPVAAAANKERNAAVLTAAKSLTQNYFARMFHSRPKARLDIGCGSWQPKTTCMCVLLIEARSRWASAADTVGASYLGLPGKDYTKMTMGAAPSVRMILRVSFGRDLFKKLRIQMIDDILELLQIG